MRTMLINLSVHLIGTPTCILDMQLQIVAVLQVKSHSETLNHHHRDGDGGLRNVAVSNQPSVIKLQLRAHE